MSATILRNVRLFTGGADLTGQSNKLEVKCEREDKDTTNFGAVDPATGNVWSSCIGGLFKTSLSGAGQWEAGDSGKVDDNAWAELGGGSVWTVGLQGAAVGGRAWFTSAMRSNYTLLGGVGDVAPWQSDALGSWPLVRGKLAHPPGTARTADGSGTALQLAAVQANQALYASLHVLSVSGTTPQIAVTVESDSSNAFASPETRIAFTTANARTGEVLRDEGAHADTWYRVVWDVSGTTPSFLFVVALGIV
ncbi:hypothetical protein Val02_82080 [Virgisporangium aliadipatigenens]|uniref:Uncharacterized protein n=1 Tax=Virgisporangium aliadipatigenens TaxID=741659 RepID=A0A8J3YVM2_9ACTN|nr:hypothetical protein [Virgisporangium aliadipatigenens]GIJ51322.1 hypothetical protein Val02_82080 [Virgisporangium aliadipatigenens]